MNFTLYSFAEVELWNKMLCPSICKNGVYNLKKRFQNALSSCLITILLRSSLYNLLRIREESKTVHILLDIIFIANNSIQITNIYDNIGSLFHYSL